MLKTVLQIIVFGLFLSAVQVLAQDAQSTIRANEKPNIIVVGAGKTLKVAGKVALFVAKESAKATWETTKFSTIEIAAPIAEVMIVKGHAKIVAPCTQSNGCCSKTWYAHRGETSAQLSEALTPVNPNTVIPI